MSNTKYYQNKSFRLLPISLIFILFIGIIISAIQIQHKNTLQSKADTSTPTIDLNNCSVSSDQLAISTEEQELLDQINVYRQQNGLSPLVWSDSLVRGASWMSSDMLLHQSLNHTDSLGRNLATRLTNCGYTPYISLGENIDSGTKDSTATLQAWKHSPLHNANLLNNNYKEAGIALASDTVKNLYFWTLDFGNRKEISTPSPSIIISTRPTITPALTPTKILTPTPTTDPGYIKNPLDMQLLINAKIFGIGNGGNPNPKHLTHYITVVIYDMKNKQVAEGVGYITYDQINLFQGVIHFGPVPDGTYYVKILSDHMLKTIVKPIFQVLNSNKLNIIPQVILRQGDINEDNAIDMLDYNLSLPCFQNSLCKNKDIIDFNDDGLINAIDYNVLLQNYLESLGD